MSSDVYHTIDAIKRPVLCYRYTNDPSPCNATEIRQYYLNYADNPLQKKTINEMKTLITAKTPENDDQARIAISLVQNIPYDYSKANPLFFQTGVPRYPFMVLYEKSGICEEKSVLLAALLKELGYGVVLFRYSPENHMAVGVKCPVQFSYNHSGYAFVETTTPAIPTDSRGEYANIGKLTSIPEIIPISDGNSIVSISEEFYDANQFNLERTIPDERNYSRLVELERKYGIVS